ncbi:hypothetical protein MES4922_290125 [Mesorhizobium ventifaucium]|uniref:Uncharacterized protein n=1 Tax=Mesorhizobium ventifaucium TaxID=666020 RepID=A0ABN8JUU4_9HYPH|nr:hypothetical protein MES4922_290125 [Mesorhizobium ventifaucium]
MILPWRNLWSDGGEIAGHACLFVSGQIEAAAARSAFRTKITHIDVNLTALYGRFRWLGISIAVRLRDGQLSPLSCAMHHILFATRIGKRCAER